MGKRASTTPSATPSLKKSASSAGQKTILGFFQKTPSTGSPASLPARTVNSSTTPSNLFSRKVGSPSGSSLTPVPSSDAVYPDLDPGNDKASFTSPTKGLPSPVSADGWQTNGVGELNARGTPTRKVSTIFSQWCRADLKAGKEKDHQLYRVR